MRRSDLAQPRIGPLIVEEYDATCVVPPGARAELDAGGNIVIELLLVLTGRVRTGAVFSPD